MQTVTDPDGGVTTYNYTPGGRPATVANPNGTVTESSYDENGRLNGIVNRKSDGAIINAYAYTLDGAGNRIQMVEQDGRTVSYAYDALNRLLSETVTIPGEEAIVRTYTFDAAGNRETKETCIGDPPVCETVAYTYNANDLLITETGPSYVLNYVYDADGNTMEKYSASESVTYEYDSKDRLIHLDTGDSLIDYEYDVDGIRILKSLNGADTSYLVDKNRPYAQVLEERDDADQLIAAYVYGNDLVSRQRYGEPRYYHVDALGSIGAMSDAAENVTDTYRYEAYGELTDTSGSTDNAYRFTGEQFDPESGMYYLRARYYDPENGRFITRDTWQGDPNRPTSLNPYGYAEGNPVVFVDPSGHFSLGEAMVTVATISVLSTVSTPSFTDYSATIGGTGDSAVWTDYSSLNCLGYVLGTKFGKLCKGTGPNSWISSQNKNPVETQPADVCAFQPNAGHSFLDMFKALDIVPRPIDSHNFASAVRSGDAIIGFIKGNLFEKYSVIAGTMFVHTLWVLFCTS